MITAKSQYAGLRSSLGRYWRGYGGWKAVWTSPILHVAVFINVICYSYWFDEGWVALSLSLLPSILGFSLGTYALVFSLLTSRIKIALKETVTDSGASYLDELNSLFMHFLVSQTVAIVFAVIYQSTLTYDMIVVLSNQDELGRDAIKWLAPIGGALGCLLLLYALLSIASAALVVYRLATVVEPD